MCSVHNGGLVGEGGGGTQEWRGDASRNEGSSCLTCSDGKLVFL